MLRLILLLALFLQVDHTTPSSRVAGILEVPEIFGEFACDRYVPQSVTLRSQPSPDSTPIGVLELLKPWYLDEGSPCEWIEVGFRDAVTSETVAVRFMEYSYEEAGLIVTESQEGWFRVDLGTVFGWIRPQSPDRFHSYEELVEESLAFVKPGWQGRLWASPGVGDPVDLPQDWRPHLSDELTVEVLEHQIVGGELWFQIRLDPDYGCGSLPDAPPTSEGWIPGYAATGENSIWFYSRGC